jgi:hypothetical protein
LQSSSVKRAKTVALNLDLWPFLNANWESKKMRLWTRDTKKRIAARKASRDREDAHYIEGRRLKQEAEVARFHAAIAGMDKAMARPATGK